MKKIQTLFLFTALAFAAHAQDQVQATNNEQSNPAKRIYKPFKVDVSLGFALPLGGSSEGNGGALFAVEPKYAVTSHLAIGLRLEVAAMARAVTVAGDEFTGEASGNASGLLTADYLITNKGFRPFIGAGAGMFGIASTTIVSSNPVVPEEIPSETKFGYMVRGGFETGHLRFAVEYNIVGSTTFSPNNNYLGFKLGIGIGGGRYK